MRISKRGLAITCLLVVVTILVFYFINQNKKRTTENFSLIIQTNKTLKNINASFYKINRLELTTQNYIITGNPAFEKEALQQIAALRLLANDFDTSIQSNGEYSIRAALLKTINFQLELIRISKISQKDASVIIGSTENKNLTASLYQSFTNWRNEYTDKLILLVEKSGDIDKANLQTSLLISLCSIILLVLTLFQVFRNKHLRKLAETDTHDVEVKYKNLVEDSGVGLLTTNLNGDISFINKRIISFTGFEADEVIGKHFSSLVDPQWAQVINEQFKEQFQTKEYQSYVEFPLKVKSGNTIWVEQSSVILSENGKPKGFQCIVKDITEKKRIEEELKKIGQEREEHQFRLQSILDNTPLIIFIKGLDGRYLLANKTYKDVFHLTEKQIIGKTDFDLVGETDAKRYEEIDSYVIKEQKNVEIEETIQQGDERRNLLLAKFPLFDKHNNIYGIGGIATDITERYLYGMHLIEAKSKAETAEQLQEEFLANMSHEIRTPMNGIIGMTDILLGSSLNEEQRDFLQVIKKSSDSLLILMNDILDLSKIKAGKLRIEKINFRLRETLETTIAAFRVLINEKGLKLRVSVGLDVPDSLEGDPHRLNQILNNLLSNAIKFTEQGEIRLEIKLLHQQSDEIGLEFSVSDSGIGISTDRLQYIFESFAQAETGTSRKFGGSGLGLSITKKLIELQKGAIEVSSLPGEGATFTFTIKYSVPPKTVAKQHATAKREALNKDGLTGKRILVVEDNEANQKVIYHMLQKAGIETDLAENGKVAIKLLQDGFEYDLIIMDLQMPEMDGFETTAFIRGQLHLSIPIIAMTASSLRNEKEKCLESGMNEYLNKPFVPSDLFRELKRFLLKEEGSVITVDKADPVYNESQKLYSLSHLLELDDTDCLCEVLQIFIESVPALMNEIKNAIVRESWEEVYQKSHKLKSSIGILQMGRLLSIISKIEVDAKERKNLELIPENFEKAEALFLKIKPLIETELKNTLPLVKN